MTFNPTHINPPEPRPGIVADCDYCGDELDREDMVDLGDGRWCCRDAVCLGAALVDKVNAWIGAERELQVIKARSQRLIEEVTHGVTYNGSVDFGRWDIEPTQILGEGEDYLVLRPNPNHGRYRVVQLAGD